MLDHVIITVQDLDRSVAFYTQALTPLGITQFMKFEGRDGHPDLVGFGDGKRGFFWLQQGTPAPAIHFAFAARNPADVDRFFDAALTAGGRSRIAPTIRHEYYDGYYATDVLDPNGYSIEVVHKR
ncbi:MAG: VOC family protein [Kofleriaceae bacterium]